MMLNALPAGDPLRRAASVLTIHNIAHQARFPSGQLGLLGLPLEYFRADGLEDHGALSPFKGGLYHATKLTAVSPRYAAEIRTAEGGAGLDGLMRFRAGDLVGILNGIDEEVWDPATDPNLPARFSASDLSGKAACKRALQRELGLGEHADVPLIGVVSRMGDQKGSDVIAAALDGILGLGVQLAMLGSGDPELERFFAHRSHHGGDRFRAFIGYSEPLAHRIEAASDLFLMPSRFEPCGLNQMYSQRYGTLPIVRATGGLDDTVDQCDPARGAGTGFKLWDLSPYSLVETTRWATDIYRQRRDLFHAMQVRSMQKRYGWDLSAKQYGEVYRWAVAARLA
jgi:starch synthase